MVVDVVAGDRVGAASGGFAYHDGAFQVLEVVAELFGTGESSVRVEHVRRIGGR